MPINVVGRTDPESFTSTSFLGFGGRAIAYSPDLGTPAVVTAIETIFRFNIDNYLDATEVAFCIYDATTRALLETIIVPSSTGTGLQQVAMAGTTQFTAGQPYKIVVYNNGAGEQISLATDPSSRSVGFVDGDLANPIDPIPAEPFTELFPNREWFWEIQGDDPPPPSSGGEIIKDVLKPILKDLI